MESRSAGTGDGVPRVLIVGAGFGGLWAARALAGAPVEVLLLDRNNFHTFYPLLYQVGAAEIEPTEIAYPVRKTLRGQANARFMMAEVDEVDFADRTLRAGGRSLSYDYLILATGSASHFFGVPGAEEHAFPLRRIEEALALRNHLLERFERADRLREPELRRRALSFTVVGGGPTGVEFAGALAELVYGPVLKDFPALTRADVKIRLLEATDTLLAGMPPELGAYATERLQGMGVEVRFGATVEEVGADRVRLAGGGEVATETVAWTAGVQGDPDAARWGLPTGSGGRVDVEPTLQVAGRPEVQVAGDLALVRGGGEAGGEGASPLPMLAPVATQQGEHAARNVLRLLAGREALPFEYDDPGMMAVIGRNHAVARVFGVTFTGFPAWLLWLSVHIAKLIGFRNRLVVLTAWAWDYFTYERFARLILPRAPGRGKERGAAVEPE